MEKDEVVEVKDQQSQPQVKFDSPSTINIPEEYKPIGMWGYFGYQLLFAIPCVGLIVLIVFAVGGTRNVNLKNFARSYFCWLIVCVVLFIILAILGVSFFGIFSSINNY